MLANITLLGLAFAGRDATQSGLFTFSGAHSSMTVARSHFSCFTAPVVASSWRMILDVRDSTFFRFLGQAIRISQSDFDTATFESHRSALSAPTNVSNCIFRLCISRDDQGGAIFTMSDIHLKNCWFVDNTALRGGHVYVGGALTAESVTFEDGYSPSCAGFANEGKIGKDLSVSLTVFTCLESQDHSCFGRYGSGTVVIDAVNMSTETADESNAGVDICDSDVTIKNCLFFDMRAPTNTGVVIQNSISCRIERCLFWLVKSLTPDAHSAACVLVQDTNTQSVIEKCTFLDCTGGAPIRALTSRVLIVDPCGDSVSSSLSPSILVQHNDPQHHCDEMHQWAVPGQVGYSTKHPFHPLEALVIGASVLGSMLAVALMTLLVLGVTGRRRKCLKFVKNLRK